MKNHLWIGDAIAPTKKVKDILSADFLTSTQKAQNICRMIGSSIGEKIGEALIPLPGIGAYIGNVVGAVAGDAVFFCTTYVIPSICKFISSWF